MAQKHSDPQAVCRPLWCRMPLCGPPSGICSRWTKNEKETSYRLIVNFFFFQILQQICDVTVDQFFHSTTFKHFISSMSPLPTEVFSQALVPLQCGRCFLHSHYAVVLGHAWLLSCLSPFLDSLSSDNNPLSLKQFSIPLGLRMSSPEGSLVYRLLPFLPPNTTS